MFDAPGLEKVSEECATGMSRRSCGRRSRPRQPATTLLTAWPACGTRTGTAVNARGYKASLDFRRPATESIPMSKESAFPKVSRIEYEGPKSKNPLAFKHYNAEELVDGKLMKAHLRFS